MSKPWFDPSEDPDRPRPVRDFMVYFAAAVIGCFVLVNLVRGFAGQGWNW